MKTDEVPWQAYVIDAALAPSITLQATGQTLNSGLG